MKRGLIIMLSLVMFGFMSCDNGSSPTNVNGGNNNQQTTNDWGAWSSWSEWVVTTPATTTTEGVETRTRTRTCNNTGQIDTGTETRPIPVVVVQQFTFSVIAGVLNITGRGTVVGSEIVIPDYNINDIPVRRIFENAFRNEGLTSVTIGNNIELIQAGAFAENPGLTSVTIPPTVNVIAPGAFDPHVQLIGWPRD